jgi:AmmeMemoRadiSam system protein A
MSTIVFACISPHPPVIVPEVGHGREGETRRTTQALQQVAHEMASLRAETVVIISPHGPVSRKGAGILTAAEAHGDMRRWDAPQVVFDFETDPDAVREIQAEAEKAGLPLVALGGWDDGATDGLDWGCTVPLYYLRSGIGEARLVVMAPSFGPPQYHYEVGQAVGRALSRLGRRTVVICSADLSHCLLPGAPSGYDPAGREFDTAYEDAVATWDVDWVLAATREFRIQAAEDAIPQTAMLMGALSGCNLRPRILSYEGPFGVGYMVAAIEVAEPSAEGERAGAIETPAAMRPPEPQHPFVQLAKQTVERYVRADRLDWPPELTAECERALEGSPPSGVFVSIKKWGDLRGCIGTIEATQTNVCIEIVHNAVAACSRDPRFLPVTEEELAHLSYSVDVLTEPELIEGPDELDPKIYGVVVESGRRRGLLLPDLEGVDGVDEQLRIARTKAGIGDDEEVRLYRFEVQRFT